MVEHHWYSWYPSISSQNPGVLICKQERIQYVIQRPMPSFTFDYLQPKDIDLWYILLPKSKLSRFSVLALSFLPIFWFYNSSPIFMLLGLALLALLTWGLSTIPVHFPVLWFGLYFHLLVPLNVRKWGAI